MEKTVDRRVRKTKNQLRQGLARLMVKKSLKEITVKELTDLVDMNRGTFYLHYRDIYDMAEKIEDEIMVEFQDILDSVSDEELSRSLLPLFPASTHIWRKTRIYARRFWEKMEISPSWSGSKAWFMISVFRPGKRNTSISTPGSSSIFTPLSSAATSA